MSEKEFERYIKEHFRYENGKLSRDDRKNSLGSKDKDGYVILKIKGKKIAYHRVVWFLCKGKFPKNEIDHINRIRDDNRIENLRDVTRQENVDNTTRVRNKETGEFGIYLDKTTKRITG